MSEENAAGELTSFRALPKAEVHVHLDGAFDPLTLEKWSAEAGLAMPRPRKRLFEFQGLADFLQFLDWACGLVDSAARLEEMAYGRCRRLAADGTRYADVIINPPTGTPGRVGSAK
jgi:adenosine deaminase